MRIYDLAKLVGVESKEMVSFLNDEGFEIKVTNSANEEIIQKVKVKYKYEGEINDEIVKQYKKIAAKTASPKKSKNTPKKVKTAAPVFFVKKKVKQKKEIEEDTFENDEKIVEGKSTQDSDINDDVKKEVKTVKNLESEIKSDEKTLEAKKEESKKVDIPDAERKIEEVSETQIEESQTENKKIIKQRIFNKKENKKTDSEQKNNNNLKVEKKQEPALKKDAEKDKNAVFDKNKDSKSKLVAEDPENKVVEKKKFVKKNLQQITNAIKSISKRKNKKKTKLMKMLKKKKIAEKMAEEYQRDLRAEKLIKITDPTTPQEVAEKMNISISDVVGFLLKNGEMITANHKIDADLATMVATEFGFEVEVEKLFEETDVSFNDIEETVELNEDRPPVVTIMGHVDHGKTTLLDSIRSSNIISSESGGITQHIGAYKVKYKGKDITFLDTPGHKAFSSMRSRGADVTDIVILIVAADDGMMPQTIEAMNHAKAAKVPIIIAINKIDRPNADIERVKQQFASHNLLVEDWGGDILCCEISAVENKGIDQLLEVILLQSEMLELKANSNVPAVGTVVEASMKKGQGSTLNILVQNGTLRKGDPFVAGVFSGKVRAMFDENHEKLEEAGPSTPVTIIGCSDVPEAGEPFNVVESEKVAREISNKRILTKKETEEKKKRNLSLENLFSEINKKEQVVINIILRADVSGSVEAIHSSLQELATEKVLVNIIHEGVGAITETDVSLAAASNAIIVGFKIRPENLAKKEAEREGIDIRVYDVIYQLIDDVKAAMIGMLDKVVENSLVGIAEVREVFKVSKLGKIAGSLVLEGKIVYPAFAKLVRDNVVLYDSKLFSLRHYKSEVKEVLAGSECGIGFENYEDIRKGDKIECYLKIEKEQKL